MKRGHLTCLCAVIAAGLLLGCDSSAKSDLKAADKMLKEADALQAGDWASEEYNKAQKLLVEAMDLAKVNAVNEARAKAEEAKGWAQEAIDFSRMRQAEMQSEKDKLQGFK